MTELCFRVVRAAREGYGGPPVLRDRLFCDVDLPRYYRRMRALSQEPRTSATVASFYAVYDQSAEYLMTIGVWTLLERGDLAPGDRTQLEGVRDFTMWTATR